MQGAAEPTVTPGPGSCCLQVLGVPGRWDWQAFSHPWPQGSTPGQLYP